MSEALFEAFPTASDTPSCLQSLVVDVLKSHLSTILFKIRKILFTRAQPGIEIQFLLVTPFFIPMHINYR